MSEKSIEGSTSEFDVKESTVLELNRLLIYGLLSEETVFLLQLYGSETGDKHREGYDLTTDQI